MPTSVFIPTLTFDQVTLIRYLCNWNLHSYNIYQWCFTTNKSLFKNIVTIRNYHITKMYVYRSMTHILAYISLGSPVNLAARGRNPRELGYIERADWGIIYGLKDGHLKEKLRERGCCWGSLGVIAGRDRDEYLAVVRSTPFANAWNPNIIKIGIIYFWEYLGNY